MSAPGQNEHSRAALTSEEQSEWQAELDSPVVDLDSRLSHPCRPAGDNAPHPMLPQFAGVGLTAELIDDIARSVFEQIRRAPRDVTAPPPTYDDPAPVQSMFPLSDLQI